MNFFKLAENLGWGQKRCSHCLKPFFPAQLSAKKYPTLRLCQECQNAILPYTGPRCKLCGNPFLESESNDANLNQYEYFPNILRRIA